MMPFREKHKLLSLVNIFCSSPYAFTLINDIDLISDGQIGTNQHVIVVAYPIKY